LLTSKRVGFTIKTIHQKNV